MSNLVILRHGQSKWNLENKFTGWVDIDLSEKGIEEAKEAGKKLMGFKFDIAFTSVLKRAQNTLDIILKEIGQENLEVKKNLALNERMYGDLQGLNKNDVKEKYGEEQFKLWRRSYDVAPPNGESLKDTSDRVLPYYKENIEPLLKQGKNVLISAHGNSLRALVMYLENLTKEQIIEREIATGVPVLYVLDENLNIKEIKNL